MDGSGQTCAKHSHLFDEFFNAWHFLGRPADAVQQFQAKRSPSYMDPSRLFACGYTHAVLNGALIRIHYLSHRLSSLLAQSTLAWGHPLWQLAVCAACRTPES